MEFVSLCQLDQGCCRCVLGSLQPGLVYGGAGRSSAHGHGAVSPDPEQSNAAEQTAQCPDSTDWTVFSEICGVWKI